MSSGKTIFPGCFIGDQKVTHILWLLVMCKSIFGLSEDSIQGIWNQKGWICPVCGRGVAPWVDVCPCQSDFKITYGTSTGAEQPDGWKEYYGLFEKKNHIWRGED